MFKNEFEKFNVVTQDRMLSHFNVMELMSSAYTGTTSKNYAEENRLGNLDISIIGKNPQIRESTRDSILKFLNQEEPKSPKCSLAACIARLDHWGQATGNTHWICLHLTRKQTAKGEEIDLYLADSAYYYRYLPLVKELIQDLKNTKTSEIKRMNTTLAKIQSQEIIFNEPQMLHCTQQTGLDCGYHAVFNAISLLENQIRNHEVPTTIHPSQSQIQDFLEASKTILIEKIQDPKELKSLYLASARQRKTQEIEIARQLELLTLEAELKCSLKSLTEELDSLGKKTIELIKDPQKRTRLFKAVIRTQPNENQLQFFLNLEKSLQYNQDTETLSTLNLAKIFQEILSQISAQMQYDILRTKEIKTGEVEREKITEEEIQKNEQEIGRYLEEMTKIHYANSFDQDKLSFLNILITSKMTQNYTKNKRNGAVILNLLEKIAPRPPTPDPESPTLKNKVETREL